MPRRRAFTLVEVLVVIGIIALLIAMLLPAIQAIREAARRLRCQNNLHQIGIAIMSHVDIKQSFPAGWTANDASERPGWSWAVQVLPYLDEPHPIINLSSYLDLPAYQALRRQALSIFLCPSDGADAIVTFPPSMSTPGARSAASRSTMAVSLPPLANPLLTAGRSNYAAVFGTEPIENSPDYSGNGVFFRNSHVKFVEINRGKTRTALVGERSARTGAATWVGVIPGADHAMERILGTGQNLPNFVLEDDVANFSSEHGAVTNFLFVEGVKAIADDIDPAVYRAMASRDGLGGQAGGSGIASPPPPTDGSGGGN